MPFFASEISANDREVHLDPSSTHNFQGVLWNLEENTLSLQFKLVDRPFTKRGILAGIGLIYDPLGFVAPVTLKDHLLLREILDDICNQSKSYGWDTPRTRAIETIATFETIYFARYKHIPN